MTKSTEPINIKTGRLLVITLWTMRNFVRRARHCWIYFIIDHFFRKNENVHDPKLEAGDDEATDLGIWIKEEFWIAGVYIQQIQVPNSQDFMNFLTRKNFLSALTDWTPLNPILWSAHSYIVYFYYNYPSRQRNGLQ